LNHKMVTSKTLVHGPIRINLDGHELEYSIHTCPAIMFRDLIKIFPDQAHMLHNAKIDSEKRIYIIPTFQPTLCNMTEFTDESEKQKNSLLNIFTSFATKFCQKMSESGYWADFTDPVTGYPVNSTNGGMLYSDVDSCEILLKYRMESVCNTCRMVSHPEWKTSVYPATMFAIAPLHQILAALPPC
jgi:ribosomal protein S8